MVSTLHYAITRRAPANQKALQRALRAQDAINKTGVLGQDQLKLAPVSNISDRPALNFPFVRVLPGRIGPYAAPDPFGENQQTEPPNAFATGTTKVRDLFAAHVVAAFLRVLSEEHPEVVLELREETGQFVIPLATFIRDGRFELNRSLLNAQRERALEASGDPNAGAAFLLAETRALNGEFLTDVPVADYMDIPAVLDIDQETYRGASVGELATYYVRRVVADAEPAPAR